VAHPLLLVTKLACTKASLARPLVMAAVTRPLVAALT